MGRTTVGLLRQPEFLKLWLARAISQTGSQVTALALPLTAAVLLGASPPYMGLLRAASSVSDVLLGPVAGAWIDRLHRRPLLIAVDVGRAVLLGTIPAAALSGMLTAEQLVVVALAGGALGTVARIAQRAFIVTVVPRPDLIEANSKLGAVTSASQVLGRARQQGRPLLCRPVSGVQVAERLDLLGLHRADDLGISVVANVGRHQERRPRGKARRSGHRFEQTAGVAQGPGLGAWVGLERLGLDQAANLVGQRVGHLLSEPGEASVPSGVDTQPTPADDPAPSIDA